MLGKRVAWKYMLRCCLLYAYNYSSLSLCHHTKIKTTIWIHFHHRNFPFLRLFRFLYIFSRFSLCVYFRLGSLSLSALFVACTTTSQLHWSERDSNTMWDLRFFFVYFVVFLDIIRVFSSTAFLFLFEFFLQSSNSHAILDRKTDTRALHTKQIWQFFFSLRFLNWFSTEFCERDSFQFPRHCR